MSCGHLDRTAVAVSSSTMAYVLRSGLSAVNPARPAVDDRYGWFSEPCYPPSWDAFGRMRGTLTVEIRLALKTGRTLEVAAGASGLTAALVRAGHWMTSTAGLATESMFVWATPLHTGQAGLRFFAGEKFVAIVRAAEWLVQRLPMFIRRRLCYSLVSTIVKARGTRG